MCRSVWPWHPFSWATGWEVVCLIRLRYLSHLTSMDSFSSTYRTGMEEEIETSRSNPATSIYLQWIYSLFAHGRRCNSSSRNRMDCFWNGVCEWWEDQHVLRYESFQIASIPWSKVAKKATTCCIFRSFGGQRTLLNCPCRLVHLVWVYERSFWT